MIRHPAKKAELQQHHYSQSCVGLCVLVFPPWKWPEFEWPNNAWRMGLILSGHDHFSWQSQGIQNEPWFIGVGWVWVSSCGFVCFALCNPENDQISAAQKDTKMVSHQNNSKAIIWGINRALRKAITCWHKLGQSQMAWVCVFCCLNHQKWPNFNSLTFRQQWPSSIKTIKTIFSITRASKQAIACWTKKSLSPSTNKEQNCAWWMSPDRNTTAVQKMKGTRM